LTAEKRSAFEDLSRTLHVENEKTRKAMNTSECEVLSVLDWDVANRSEKWETNCALLYMKSEDNEALVT